MKVLNFSHPLSDEQRAQIEAMAGMPIERVMDIPTQFDQARSFVSQARELLDSVGLTPAEWQSQPLLVNLPSLSGIVAVLLAELHGRMGHFPPVLRLRPVANAVTPRYEVAEVINLQQVRDEARGLR